MQIVQGQDQMRIVKQRLLEMLPDAKVFLDVRDPQSNSPQLRFDYTPKRFKQTHPGHRSRARRLDLPRIAV